MRTRLRLATMLAFAAALFAGCGDDDPTGPSETFSLAGQWSLSVANATVDTVVCSYEGLMVTFTDTNGTLGGTLAADVTISCVINGQTQTSPFGGTGALTSVTLNGSAVTFAFPTAAGPSMMSGTVESDNRMSGSASITLSFSGQPTTLNGTWIATRM